MLSPNRKGEKTKRRVPGRGVEVELIFKKSHVPKIESGGNKSDSLPLVTRAPGAEGNLESGRASHEFVLLFYGGRASEREASRFASSVKTRHVRHPPS